MDFFSLFYQVGLYGEDLFYHLKGWDSGLQDFVQSNNQFMAIWCITAGASLFMAVLYYFILNHPRLNRTWIWTIFMAVLSVGMFFYGRTLVVSDIFGRSLHPVDPALNVGLNNAMMFGVYEAVLAALFFFLFSVAMKWGSKNCKNVPFKAILNRK